LGLISDADYARLSEPFGPWLKANGMDAMHRLARRSTVAMGYGFLSQSSRLWGYRWNKPTLIYTGLVRNTREPTNGWMTFWQALAERFHVKRRHRVVDLRRSGGRVQVIAERPARDGEGHETVEEVFDQVVVAVPLPQIAPFEGATADETWLAEHLESTRYATTLVEVDGWFDEPVDTRAYSERLLPPAQRRRRGEPMDRPLVARRTSRKGGGDRPLFVVYQYIDPRFDPRTNPDTTEASLRERLVHRLREDLAEDGATLREVLDQRLWDYFPRLTREGIAAGGPNRLARMQGREGVWYTGGSVVLESIDHIVDYNTVLAKRIANAVEPRNRFVHAVDRALTALAYHGW
jgi:hypothetical protein